MYLSVRLHTYPERSKAGQGERMQQWLALQDPTSSGTGHSIRICQWKQVMGLRLSSKGKEVQSHHIPAGKPECL